MRRYIADQLDLRLNSKGRHDELETQNCVKTIIDLALDTYRHDSTIEKPSSNLDAVFRDYAISLSQMNSSRSAGLLRRETVSTLKGLFPAVSVRATQLYWTGVVLSCNIGISVFLCITLHLVSIYPNESSFFAVRPFHLP